MKYQIEKDIPFPTQTTRAMYPCEALAVGDSFFVPASDKPTSAVRSAVCAAGRRSGNTFRVSAVEGGTRVWRTA